MGLLAQELIWLCDINLTLRINASFPIIKARIKDKSKIGAKENIHQPTEEKEHKNCCLIKKK